MKQHSGSIGEGARRFASAVVARHAPAAFLPSQTEQRFLHRHLRHTAFHVHRHNHESFAPRFFVSLAGGPQPCTSLRERYALLLRERYAVTLRKKGVFTHTREISQQLILRTRRTEHSAVVPAAERWIPPVTREVLRKNAAAPQNGSRPQPGDARRGESQTASWAKRETAKPAVDINRLTDDVIQAIDRRIIAGRERMGRI